MNGDGVQDMFKEVSMVVDSVPSSKKRRHNFVARILKPRALSPFSIYLSFEYVTRVSTIDCVMQRNVFNLLIKKWLNIYVKTSRFKLNNIV